MARLIDADLLPYENQVMSYDDEWCLKVSDIEKAPTVDAVEVVHGRWVGGYSGTEYTIPKCSRCGYGNGVVGASNYCPNCGAKMEEETKFVGICEHCVYRDECDWPKLHPKIKLKECPNFKEGDQK